MRCDLPDRNVNYANSGFGTINVPNIYMFNDNFGSVGTGNCNIINIKASAGRGSKSFVESAAYKNKLVIASRRYSDIYRRPVRVCCSVVKKLDGRSGRRLEKIRINIICVTTIRI